MPGVTPITGSSIEEMLAAEKVRRAFQLFEAMAADLIREQIKICEIPAPPFGEAARAKYLREKLQELRLSEPHIDGEGNCIALRRGRVERPLIVLSAHLDTVFPAGTELTVKHAGNRLLGPGISDDGCGLIALIAIAQALKQTAIETTGSILFVGTVGEEGEGNLRGVRYLLTQGPWANTVDAFISFDGPGVERITNRALGSRRYRVEMSGTGGHSWSDFGVANPVHALGRAVAKLVSYPVPAEPRTTFNVGRIVGGTGVNSIPTSASMDVDLRSGAEDELLRLDAFFRRAIREAADEENSVRRKGNRSLELTLKLIGERPGGETSSGPLLDLAVEATNYLGVTPHFDQASTDSNIPMSLGIPAITLGAGGTSGNTHSLDEWFDPKDRHLGLQRGLLVALGIAGLHTQ